MYSTEYSNKISSGNLVFDVIEDLDIVPLKMYNYNYDTFNNVK